MSDVAGVRISSLAPLRLVRTVRFVNALHRHQELRVSIDLVRVRKLMTALCTLQGALGLKLFCVKEKRCLHLAQCIHIGSGASDPVLR